MHNSSTVIVNHTSIWRVVLTKSCLSHVFLFLYQFEFQVLFSYTISIPFPIPFPYHFLYHFRPVPRKPEDLPLGIPEFPGFTSMVAVHPAGIHRIAQAKTRPFWKNTRRSSGIWWRDDIVCVYIYIYIINGGICIYICVCVCVCHYLYDISKHIIMYVILI